MGDTGWTILCLSGYYLSFVATKKSLIDLDQFWDMYNDVSRTCIMHENPKIQFLSAKLMSEPTQIHQLGTICPLLHYYPNPKLPSQPVPSMQKKRPVLSSLPSPMFPSSFSKECLLSDKHSDLRLYLFETRKSWSFVHQQS